MQHQWTDKNKYYTFLAVIRQNFHRVSFLGHQTTLVADRISMQATEPKHKHKHKASDKTCFKHISNQKSWMQTSWFWWLIKLKRILLFSDLSWSNWKESSVSILVNPFTLLVNHVSNTYFWSILHTSGQSLTLLVNHFWSMLPMSRLQFLVNPSHF